MRRWTALAAVLVLIAAEARGAGVERFAELDRIPADAEAILGFEDRGPGAGELLSRLRDELLFASRLDERLPGLSKALDSLRVERLVAAVVPITASGEAVVAILHGSFTRAAAESVLLPAGNSAQIREGVQIRISAPREDRGRATALAFIDDNTLAFGDLQAIERSLALRRSHGRSILKNPAIRPLVDEVVPRGQAWGILLPQWFHFPEPQQDPRYPCHGVRQALVSVRSALFSAQVSSQVAFHMWTRTGFDVEAFVLADAMRGFLGSFRSNLDAAPAVLKALEGAQVSAEGPVVSLRLDLSAEAMSRLRHNEASRRLLSWRLGPEDRESHEKVGEILARLEIGAGDHVADVGSGGGFYTVALARSVGENGHVFAVDIDQRALLELKRRVTEAPLRQVDVVLGAPDDPKLAADSLDAALIVNSYHEMPQHKEMLEHLWRALRPGGRVMLVEPFSPSRRNEPRESQVKDHLLAPELVEEELRDSGFEVLSRIDEFVSDSDGTRFSSLVLGRRPQPR